MRESQCHDFGANSLHGQHGSGLHGGETASAHIYVRACLDAGLATHQAVAILYIDVSDAFYGYFKCLSFLAAGSCESFLEAVHLVGFPDALVQELRSRIANDS